MKTTIALLAMLTGSFTFTLTPLVSYKTDTAGSEMSISGTSTLHDWEVEASNFNGSMEVDVFKDSISIKELKLTVPVTSLKSGKKPMDNNMYKALKHESYPAIDYRFTRLLSTKRIAPGKLEILTEGKLTVAGKTKTLKLTLTATLKDKGIEFKGSTPLKMSQFDVEAPSFMFGSVTTGDAITIDFTINFN